MGLWHRKRESNVEDDRLAVSAYFAAVMGEIGASDKSAQIVPVESAEVMASAPEPMSDRITATREEGSDQSLIRSAWRPAVGLRVEGGPRRVGSTHHLRVGQRTA